MTLTGVQIGLLLAFLGVVAGSFMPWAELGFIKANGTDGDGVFTLMLAAIGLGIILAAKTPKPLIFAAIVGGLIAAIGIYDAVNISDIGNDPDNILGLEPSVGTGLWLVILSGIVATVCSVVRYDELKRQPSSSSMTL